MTNSSSNTELVDTLADVFLTWLQNDVIPFCVTSLDIIIITVGVILNTILMVTFKQKGLMNEASTFFVLVLGIVDFIAYVFVLLPTIITAIAGKWLLSDPVCQIHGAMISLLMFANFFFLSVLAVERGLKLCKVEKHDVVFEVRKYVNIITGAVWSVASILAILPTTGLADIKYEFYHQGCMIDYETSHAFLLVNFLLTIVSSLIIFAICYGHIFNTRRHALMANRKSAFMKSQQSKRTRFKGPGNGLASISENEEDNTAFVKTENAQKGSNQSMKQSPGKHKGQKQPESPSGLSMVLEIFSDDQENPAFHLAITYISLWACILFCYLPYFIVAFYGTFDDGGLWRGLYTITLLITHISFVIKPFIYLGHNRHYRSVTKETVPEAVKKKARSVRSSISGMAGKVEDFVFKSPANKGFGNVIATHKAILIWKTKMKMKQQNMKKANDIVKDVSITNTTETDQSSTSNQTTNAKQQDRKVSFQTEESVRSQPTTPSAINLTTSSFIENERQKLMANMRSNHQVPTKNLSPVDVSSSIAASRSPELSGTPTAEEDLPGMVGGSDVSENGSSSVSPVNGWQNDQLRLI